MDAILCYAFRESSGSVEIASVGETPAVVRERMLEACLGWRYKYPYRYSHDDEWTEILKSGEVVRVSVSVVE